MVEVKLEFTEEAKGYFFGFVLYIVLPAVSVNHSISEW